MQAPKIHYFAFGGTISSTGPASGKPVSPTLGGSSLIAAMPRLAAVGEIETIDFPTVPSTAITPADIRDLAESIAAAVAAGCAGVVISHGTDMLEETAYGLALMLPREVPIILTGAMRPPAAIGADGPANMVGAFTAAACPRAAELGPVVVFNDQIHTARFATKSHTTSLGAFLSPGAGPLGEIVEGRVDLWWQPTWEDLLGLPPTLGEVNVELMRITSGGSDLALRAVIATPPDALVIEGAGAGHVPQHLLEALDEVIAAGTTVAVASRGSAGSSLESTYGIPGGEIDLVRRGALLAGRLSGTKLRLRLIVGIALGIPPSELLPVR
jgi:L-asparaginase